MDQFDSERRLRRREAAKFLQELGYPVAATTLAKLACIGGGPAFERWNRIPLYKKSSLLDWVASRMRPPKKQALEDSR